jgi:hypothetical protein
VHDAQIDIRPLYGARAGCGHCSESGGSPQGGPGDIDRGDESHD